MSGRTLRLVVVPAILFVLVSGTVFVLAQTHPAKDEGGAAAPAAAAEGDAARGEQLFAENCASCHGEGGTGGGVGPTLAGSGISIEEARVTIEAGSGVMPADLVEGQELEDVLAYLETISGDD
jgi:mono/diheme cytochrome c family protein